MCILKQLNLVKYKRGKALVSKADNVQMSVWKHFET